ncbi:phospholipase DDHD2 [Echria macrotheca]|uniref:Phospholipase DDHD2 n=1 Tax=Echria macrotheca TaxID=438768 RepID=A0AAJ0F763_9PEZI|nr:phospholipase DDHD2 [Echria macrotheca]
MASVPSEKKAEKSYLASAVDSINPWAGSRTATPPLKDLQPNPVPPNPGDHSLSPFYGQSLKRYPPDCPPLKVQWFHAVDVPKRKPKFLRGKNGDDKKPPAQAKKYTTFSTADSRALEAAYQAKLEQLEAERAGGIVSSSVRAGSKRPRAISGEAGTDATPDGSGEAVKVPVNEDFLFDVDIQEREIAPVYWDGPVYDVRRGSWFFQEGANLRACDENLAAQLEEGYLKVKPWTYPPRIPSVAGARAVTPKSSSDNLKADASVQVDAAKAGTSTPQHQPQTHRLFGTYMNSVATYQDSSVAWLTSDGMLSWVASTVYEKLGGGGYMSGIKLVRGYTEAKKAKEEKRPSTPTGTQSTSAEQEDKLQKALKRRSAPPSTRSETTADEIEKNDAATEPESIHSRLTRQLSNLIEGVEDPDDEETVRKREEKEMLDDYNPRSGENQGREIEHVVLVTHGIGQLLSIRMEGVNFVHDVNTLRKTIKAVYSSSADLRALNAEDDSGPGNCRLQVLPVIWRHLLDFPKRRQKTGERDLSDAFGEEDEYPSLDDITTEGMAFARTLISDLALDVLLYQSAYREQIAEIVLRESNRIFKKFMERNPGFKGKVHVMGHSLGSAIMFDILCRQKERAQQSEPQWNPLRIWPSQDRYEPKNPKALEFEFEVEDFYCLGSPVGLFQMLKGRTIAARALPNSLPSESPLNPETDDNPFFNAGRSNSYGDQVVSPITGLPYNVSSPKVSQLFNIFHPSDPIAYRMEPLVSTAMSSLKPQILPYTKKGIFGAVAPQGLTGIGAKVGQSVSGLWSNLSAGIASSLLNRSLGLSQEDVAKINASHTPSPGAGTNIGAGVISDKTLTDTLRSEKTAERKRQLASAASGGGGSTMSGNEATLIDDDLETLFSKFQKNRIAIAKDKGIDKDTAINVDALVEEEQKAAKMRREEMKIRALNRNGRIDYCIQESVLDFNPINTIASHMGYWADEDVSHFILSQLLANKVRTPRA